MSPRRLIGAGAIAAACLCLWPALQAPAQAVIREQIEISAPILPRTKVIYTAFPSTLEGEKSMAHDAALLFDWLLEQCAPLYPRITLAPTGTGLSDEQLATNYGEVGRCAYEQYTAKPYWIPKLVDDVDICGTEMGPGWRLITEADLSSLTDADFQALARKWSPPGAGSELSFFFSALAIWVRADDGTIKAGTLAPGAGAGRVTPLGVSGAELMDHYEGNLALRCIRRTELPPGTGAAGGEGPSGGGGASAGAADAGAGQDGATSATDASDTATATVCDGFTVPADHPDATGDYISAGGVLEDHVTGLTWETTGTAGSGVSFTEAECAMKSTGGLAGWRRPTLLELESIVDFGGPKPAIDRASFPGIQADYYATATPIYEGGRRVGPSGYGWSIDFTTGLWTNGFPPSFQFLCVREAKPLRCYRTSERFQPTSSSSVASVHDARSGLTWQRGPAPAPKTWADAEAYCTDLGNGYRLPGVKELLSILDLETSAEPAIDAAAFPGTPAGVFWSATKAAGAPAKRLATDFTRSVNASASALDETSAAYVRCVR